MLALTELQYDFAPMLHVDLLPHFRSIPWSPSHCEYDYVN